MIDTIKFLVPIKDVEMLEAIKKSFTETKRKDLLTEEVKFVYYISEKEVGSYNKNIIIRIQDNQFGKALSFEFSIPKYIKGNNVEMLKPENLTSALESFRSEVVKKFKIPLPKLELWEVVRLDICYNWIFKNKEEAGTVMNFIQKIKFPRKQKYIYETSVMYRGSSYTIKFYLKGPEFRKNDFKDISKTNYELAIELQEWANKILRYEIGFKKEYLKDLFGYKKVLIEHLCNTDSITEILNYYLRNKIFFYINLKNNTETEVENILYSTYKKSKATKLFQFYRDFYLEDGAVKRRILSGGIHRSTRLRYEKELKKLGIGFDVSYKNGESLLEQLIIPSKNSKFDLVDSHSNFRFEDQDADVL